MAIEYISVLVLAVVDSINPSALLVTVHLLLTTSSYVSRVLAYVAGIFLTYFGLGILLMLGLDAVWAWIESPVAYAAEGIAGALMLLYANIAPGGGGRSEGWRERVPRSPHVGALFTMGILVTVLECPTALPYFGAIVILTNANLAAAQWLPLLAVYNVIFTLPPLLLLASYRLLDQRLSHRFDRIQERLQRGAREAWLWMLGIVGFWLLLDSVVYFDFFGLVDTPYLEGVFDRGGRSDGAP
ncbi:MAG TPA: GAP family protein [Chloroflexota bacterium]